MSLSLCALYCAMPPMAQAQPPDASPLLPAPIERVTMQWAHKLVGGPTLITLDFENAAPQSIYEELFRQAGIAPSLSGPGLWKQHAAPLSVHLARRPFWSAVRDLEARTQLTLIPPDGSGKGYTLCSVDQASNSAPWLRGPWAASESFQVIAGEFAWTTGHTRFLAERPAAGTKAAKGRFDDSSPRTLSLYVLSDPRFGSPRAEGLRIDEAVDEKGNALRFDVDVPGFEPLFAVPGTVRLNLNLFGYAGWSDDGAAHKIRRIRGVIRLFFVSASDTWEVADPLHSLPATKTLNLREGREQYTLGRLEKTNDNAWNTTATVIRQVPKEPPGLVARVPYGSRRLQRSDLLFNILTDSLSLNDAGGIPHPTGSSASGGSFERWICSTSFPGLNAATGPPPAKIVWHIPLEWKEVEVPFEFTDLPLP